MFYYGFLGSFDEVEWCLTMIIACLSPSTRDEKSLEEQNQAK